MARATITVYDLPEVRAILKRADDELAAAAEREALRADSYAAEFQRLVAERDDARAEVARLRATLAAREASDG